MTIQESPPGASPNGSVHTRLHPRPEPCLLFHMLQPRAQIHLTSTVGPRPSLEHL
jgi:hypothetical protein